MFKLHDLVGEISTGFEGKTLRLAESVVTIEENIVDLYDTASVNCQQSEEEGHQGTYLAHLDGCLCL